MCIILHLMWGQESGHTLMSLFEALTARIKTVSGQGGLTWKVQLVKNLLFTVANRTDKIELQLLECCWAQFLDRWVSLQQLFS